jgi:hypothetical protein
MAEGAALLVDPVLPAVGYRQWGLSFTGALAMRLGYGQALPARDGRAAGGAQARPRPPARLRPRAPPACGANTHGLKFR